MNLSEFGPILVVVYFYIYTGTFTLNEEFIISIHIFDHIGT